MKTLVRNIGNSKGAVLPAQLLKALKIKTGDQLEILEENGRIILVPKGPKYTLDELIAQCDPSAAIPSEIEEWDQVKPVGQEI